MKPDGWRESLGAYALGHLDEEESAAVRAHLEGCPGCRAEAEQLGALARPMSLADPARFEAAPAPPASLAARVLAAVGLENARRRRRRRRRAGLGLGGAAAAVAAVLAIWVLPGEDAAGPEQRVAFSGLPGKMRISAKLIPNAFGTEIHMYVKGVSSGTLCRVYLRSRGGRRLSAGTFRYRLGEGSYPVLSSALDLARTEAMEVDVGDRVFTAPVAREASTPQ